MSINLKEINIEAVGKNLGILLKNNKVKYEKIHARLQHVFGGGSEIIFDIQSASIRRNKLTSFSFVITMNGDIVAQASNDKSRNLIPYDRVGNIKMSERLTEKTGIFADIVKFTVNAL